MAYALKNFSSFVGLSKYSLAFLVVAQLFMLWSQGQIFSNVMVGQLDLTLYLVSFLAVLLVFLGTVWQTTVFVHQQRQHIVQPGSAESEEKVPSNSFKCSIGRVFPALLVQGFVLTFMAFLLSTLILLLYMALATYVKTILLQFMIIGVALALGITGYLYITGLTRLFYMQYVYGDAPFFTTFSQLRSLRRYVGRTITLEVLLFFVYIIVGIVFATPLVVMTQVHNLSEMAIIKMDGTDVPSYFTALWYFSAVVAALGNAFAILLSSYPMCYNYLSIQCREAERVQQ